MVVRSHALEIFASDDTEVQIEVGVGDTLYYKSAPDVTASSNDGSLTAGQSVVVHSPTWIVSAGRSYITAEPIPLERDTVDLTPNNSATNVIQPRAVGVVPLTLKAKASQTGDLLDVTDSDGTTKRTWLDSGGRLHLRGLNDDDNLTSALVFDSPPERGTVAPFKRAEIKWLDDGDWKWSMAFDVTDGSYGPGAADFSIFHNYTPDETKSADVLYFTDEQYVRLGIYNNTPTSQLGIHSPVTDRPVLGLEHATASAVDTWILKLGYNGAIKGGFWYDSAGAGLKLGVGVAIEPDYPLDVRGEARVQQLIFRDGAYAAFPNGTDPLVYESGSTGSYPFAQRGHLILQPRSEHTGTVGDIVLATANSSGDPVPSLIIAPNGNVQVGASKSFGTSSVGVIGIADATTAPTGNPSGGGILWHKSSIFKYRSPGGFGSQIGQVGPAGESGVAFTPQNNNTADTIVYRKASDLLLANKAIGTVYTSAPADASLAAGELGIWFDSTAGAAKMMLKAKNASGTVVTGSVSLT